MKKKILSLFLAANLMIASISGSAFAEGIDNSEETTIATATDANYNEADTGYVEDTYEPESDDLELACEKEVVYADDGTIEYIYYDYGDFTAYDYGDNEAPIYDDGTGNEVAEEGDASLVTKDFSIYSNSYSYDRMTTSQKNLASSIYNNGKKLLTTTTNVSSQYFNGLGSYYVADGIYVGSTYDINYYAALVKCLLYQRPEYYFFRPSVVRSNGYLYVAVYDQFANGQTRMSYSEKIFSKIDGWVNSVNSADYNSVYMKERAIHDIVTKQITYYSGTYDQSIYSAVIQGYSVCAGYTKLYYMLANACGIETVCVSGTANGNHAWNESKVYGKWYIVDCTWDDGNGYKYFNKSTSEANSLGATRTVASTMAGWIPTAYSTYNKNVIYLDSLYVMKNDSTGVTIGAVVDYNTYAKADVEFAWYISNDGEETWTMVQDYTAGNEWLSIKPDMYGELSFKCSARPVEHSAYERVSIAAVNYHGYIKGICQMPYENGGYLIGIESYDNPNNEYYYELLILDCTKFAQGLPAWVHTSGKMKTGTNCAWTVWSPQYGYYWTLFRVFDKDKNLIDEQCYGFANI